MMYTTTPTIRRIVITHKASQSAILLDDSLEPIPGFATNAVTIWKTSQYPAELAGKDTARECGAQMYTRGSLIRVVDFPPHSMGHSHRTQSVDYAIIIDGELELALEDGSRTTARAGDVVVQQATMHQWNNLTDKPVRVIFILVPSEAYVTGERLGDSGIPDKFKVTG